MAASSTKKKQRPLSPHLQVYKPQLTSVLSILHRAAGYALAVGTVVVSAILIAAALGESAYDKVIGLMQTPVGMVLLFGWSVALFYHMCNGVRHMFWDMGFLLEIKKAYIAGYVVLIVAAILTFAVWYLYGMNWKPDLK